MSTTVRSSRSSQIVACAVASLFLLGFFFSPVGAWTGPILGVWFVGTQKPRRGFLWMLAFSFIPHLISDWRLFLHTPLADALQYVDWILLASLIAVLPFTFHRLVSPRLPGFFSTLPFPMASAAVQFWSFPYLPRNVFMFLANDAAAKLPLLHVMKGIGGGIVLPLMDAAIFLGCWFAAVVVWMWNQEFRAAKIRKGATFFGALFGVLILAEIYFRISGVDFFGIVNLDALVVSLFIPPAGVVVLAAWALLNPGKRHTWANRPETVAQLRSPFTGNPVHIICEGRREALLSTSGERFPIRNGIPVFLKPEDLTGDNGKYNHLYETIGGFYDDTQRVACAFKGLDRDEYFLVYMRMLEAKPGDSVLETSVGTGLSFKYLPHGVKLSGLDLSAEMLANCQTNLRRWEMDADLYLGNAESLPFADSSFDVVFHVGGISFFNDQAKAIREMIRVAKPGSLLLISDETEEYAKATYEKIPIASSYYKNRHTTVKIPIDLVPLEMQEIHLEMIKGGEFYAITFRKPAAVR